MSSAARLDPNAALLVFAQARDARVDIGPWNAHATRFFHCRLGLTEERNYGAAGPPKTDALAFVVAPAHEPPGVVEAHARPTTDDDLAAAARIEARRGAAGLGLLARRCSTVWLISRSPRLDQSMLKDPVVAQTERLTMWLAAVIASLLLGPILDARADELYGVKTARAKLESA